MSLDLFERESQERVSALPHVTTTEPGVWDGFMRGAGLYTMRGLARIGRSIDLLGSVGPILKDAATGGTELQDRYFREHDDVWGSAVEHWTPKPGEVGVAGEVAGQLLSVLPVVIASPGLAVADAMLGTAEDLSKKGVDATKAQAVGAVQGAGLALGIWVPILGRNGWERVLVGGAGFNAAQGIVTRAASGAILEGHKAAEEFHAFDGTALTIDVLLGMAFGGWAHLNPEMRAQGKQAWERIHAWAQSLLPSDVAALAALRQAQHANVDSVPGKAATPQDLEAHSKRLRTATEQILRGEPVELSNLPSGTFEPDPQRLQEGERTAAQLVKEAERVRKIEGLPPVEEATASAPAEGPTAMPGASEPPPPRGSRAAEAVGPEAPTQLERVTPEPLSFKTAKGSTYDVETDGTTTRNKAARPEHPGDEGPQPRSERTVYVTKEHANLLGEIQAIGGTGKRQIHTTDDGRIGVAYTSGPDIGKFERRTLVPFETAPAVGRIPVELWEGGRRVHFGNEIVEITTTNSKLAPSFEPLTLEAQAMREQLENMAKHETGWEVIGGRRARADLPGGVVNFTPWIPKAEWWRHRPGKMNEAQVQEAVRKALAGEPLKMSEQRMVDYMVEVANERLDGVREVGGVDEWANIVHDLQETGLEPVTRDVVDADAVAKAVAIDEDRVVSAAIRYENSDAAFMAEIRAIIDGNQEKQDQQADGGRQEDRGAPGEAPGAGERAKEAVDPVAAAAERYVAEQPHRLLRVGTNPDGSPQYKTAQEFLDDARADAAAAREDMKLFEIAANCLLGGGRS